MALFDFIGSGPDQLTPGEVFSGLAEAIGPVLVGRGRKLGLPIGLGLTAFGGLGELLAKKQADYGHQQGLIKALQSLQNPKGLKPDFGIFATNVLQGGGTSAEAESLWKSSQGVSGLKPFPIINTKTHEERMYDPNLGQPIPPDFVSASFYKPGKPDKESTFQEELELFKKDPATFRAVESAMHPATNINTQLPTSPADFVHDKETNMWGYYTHDKAGNATFVPVSRTAPERLPTSEKPKTIARGTIKWKGNTYTTVKNPDGSMEATPSETAPWFGPPLKKKLFFPPNSSTPIEVPLGATVGKH